MIYVEYAYTVTPGLAQTRLCHTIKEAEHVRDALDFEMKRSGRYAYVRVVDTRYRVVMPTSASSIHDE